MSNVQYPISYVMSHKCDLNEVDGSVYNLNVIGEKQLLAIQLTQPLLWWSDT